MRKSTSQKQGEENKEKKKRKKILKSNFTTFFFLPLWRTAVLYMCVCVCVWMGGWVGEDFLATIQ